MSTNYLGDFRKVYRYFVSVTFGPPCRQFPHIGTVKESEAVFVAGSLQEEACNCADPGCLRSEPRCVELPGVAVYFWKAKKEWCERCHARVLLQTVQDRRRHWPLPLDTAPTMQVLSWVRDDSLCLRWCSMVVDFSESTVVAPKGSTAYPHLSTASQCIDRRVSVIVAYILAQVFLTGFIVLNSVLSKIGGFFYRARPRRFGRSYM